MTAPQPQPRLADLGPLWTDMLSGLSTFQADLLRRVGKRMGAALDQDAMSDIEGVREWRNTQGKRYAE